jgi:hypothetical protein
LASISAVLALSVKKSSEEIALRFPIPLNFSLAASSSSLDNPGELETTTYLVVAISKGSFDFISFLLLISTNLFVLGSKAAAGWNELKKSSDSKLMSSFFDPSVFAVVSCFLAKFREPPDDAYI